MLQTTVCFIPWNHQHLIEMRSFIIVLLPVALFILINGTSANKSQDSESSVMKAIWIFCCLYLMCLFKPDLVWSTSSEKCEKKLQDYIKECEPTMRAGKKNIVEKRRPTKKTFKGKKKSVKKTKKKKMLNCKAWLILFCLLSLHQIST